MNSQQRRQLVTSFSESDYGVALEELMSARKRGLEAVFPTLGKLLDDPGIKQIDTDPVAAGITTSSGWSVPEGPGDWPVMVAEIPGNGVPYLKTEVIRAHAVVVPLRLDTSRPRLAGAAMAVALLHGYAAFVRKSGRVPQRSLRFVFTSCDAATEAFLERPRVLGPQVFSAMELDLRDGKTTSLGIDSANLGHRSFVAEALLDSLSGLGLRERRGGFHSLTQRPFSIPFASLGGTLAKADLRQTGYVLMNVTALLGDTDYEDAVRFVRPLFQAARKAMKDNPGGAKRIYGQLVDVLKGIDLLVHRGPWWVNPSATIRRHRKQGILVDDKYYPRYAYQMWQEDQLKRLKRLLPERKQPPESTPQASPALLKRARAMVPAKAYFGALGPAGLGQEVLPWMQAAASLASGKKTVEAIHLMLQREGIRTALPELLRFFEMLEKKGLIKRSPVVTTREIRQALKDAGIEAGDTVMAHTGYAAYGYIECGPKGLIDLLQEAVGPEGTLCMPAHTLSLVGNPPFDPQITPASTGLVPNVFLKCPGVMRGLHPTHSVAARGPLAEHLLAGSSPDIPVFGKGSFWDRFEQENGKILMFSNSLGPNTFLHGVDYQAGVALPDSIGHVIEKGVRREMPVYGIPFHTDSFKHMYKVIEKKGLIRQAPLGKGTVYAMRAKEICKAGKPVLRRNPLLATAPGCDCDYCAHLRRAVARRARKG